MATASEISWLDDLYRHMEWADARVWSAVLACEGAPGDEALRRRLHHVHLVQRAFLSVWRGEPVDATAGEALDLAALAAWARDYHPEARAFLETSATTALLEPVRLPWSAHVRDQLGLEPAPTTLRDTALQVCGHTAHHRGQVMLQLRALGATPPLVDFIAWVWLGRPAPDWP